MNRLGIIFLFIFPVFVGRSQDDTLSIKADRPGMATPPSVLDAKKFQIETGIAYEKIDLESTSQTTFYFNTPLIRYGVNKFSELRVQTNYLSVNSDGNNITGFDPITIGTKIFLLKQKRILPEISALVNITLPWSGKKDFRPDRPAPSFYLLMQKDIGDRFSLCYNMGMEYDGSDNSPGKFAALCLGFSINDKLSCFIENYDWFIRNSVPDEYIDCGFSYLIKRDLQIDLTGNLHLDDSWNYLMVSTGLAWMIKE